MTFVPRSIPGRKLRVSDQSITMVFEYTGLMKWLRTQKSISAGKIRTIREIRDKSGKPIGLFASERSRFGAQMFGGVYIPSDLPEYERIKILVEGWKAPESTG